MIKLLLCVLLIIIAPRVGAASVFSDNNPDIDKYGFAKSYITALSYLKNIDDRWTKNSPKKVYASNETAMINGSIEYLVKDNGDLRITKNYLMKYIPSKNALMRKTADTVVVACDKGISLNNQEKKLWEQWLKLKTSGLGTTANERVFVKAQRNISLERKEIDKTIIEASVLFTKVLRSAANPDEQGHLLAITRAQRKKLIGHLDRFAKTTIDWGLKPGQRPLAASVAVIREVLEDPVWVANDARK